MVLIYRDFIVGLCDDLLMLSVCFLQHSMNFLLFQFGVCTFRYDQNQST